MEESIDAYEKLSDVIFILKIFFIIFCTYYTNFKISSNNKITKNIWQAIAIILITAITSTFINNSTNYCMVIIISNLIISVLYSKNTNNNIGYSIINTTISLGINYIIYFISIIISFLPEVILNLPNDYFRILIIMLIHFSLLNLFFRVKRFKKGITFIKNKTNNEYCEIIVLNIAVIIILVATILSNLGFINYSVGFYWIIILGIFSIIMIITIQRTLTMYYKHKQLEKTLKETETELEEKKKEITKLEEENLNFSKTSHSIAHKQRVLENKLNELMMNSEIANELDIKNKIEEISNSYSSNVAKMEISKTEIPQIDDMLNYMKSECEKKNIEFELQLNESIHHMTNKYVSKDELEILLADHIKDAIIAIEHSDNINRSILVKLGLVDDSYGLYIYDSGIEFEIDTLINLGSKPVTTHANEGGTGMGFLNTFDTLKKHNGSLIINEIGKPCKDNYTKVIMIKFDNLGEFKVKSYRAEEIKKIDVNKRFIVEPN